MCVQYRHLKDKYFYHTTRVHHTLVLDSIMQIYIYLYKNYFNHHFGSRNSALHGIIIPTLFLAREKNNRWGKEGAKMLLKNALNGWFYRKGGCPS
jgi:hypothetical protein